MLNFIASSDLMSFGRTGVIVRWLILTLHLRVSNIDELNHVLRKLGHLTAYMILGYLMFRAWRASLPVYRRVMVKARSGGAMVERYVRPLWTARWSVLAILLTALAAAFDEYHQSFVPSRGASVYDVILDTAGCVFMQLCLMVVLITRTREQ